MPIRKATLEETRAWLGSGLVMPAPKPLPPSPENSTPSPLPQEMLDEVFRRMEEGFRAQSQMPTGPSTSSTIAGSED
jgi:hypothetical protein